MIDKNVSLCDGNTSIFICNYHKEDATLRVAQLVLRGMYISQADLYYISMKIFTCVVSVVHYLSLSKPEINMRHERSL